MRFNEYLKSCRERYHLTQEQLVQELYNTDDSFQGLDVGTLSRWERGMTRPSIRRQIEIVRHFQHYSKNVFPCFDGLSHDDIEAELCKAGAHNLLAGNKRFIFDFPSYIMQVGDLKMTHIRHTDDVDRLLKMPYSLHQRMMGAHMKLAPEHLKAWALDPRNLFLITEFQEQTFGMLFALRLRPEVFKRVIAFTLALNDLDEKDFANLDEPGCILSLVFFAYNDQNAVLLLIRHYAHLIAEQESIEEVGALTAHPDGRRFVKRLHFKEHHTHSTFSDIVSYRGSLESLLLNEDVLKMLFQKDECPEDSF